MEKWKIRPPLPQKPPNRSSPKFAWVTTSWTPPPMQNFIKIRLPPFAPQIRENSRGVTRLVFFFGSSFSLQPRPLYRFARSIRQMTSFRARMYFLGSPKQNFIFRSLPPKKGKFLANFRRDLRKFRVKKALTMAMLGSQLHNRHPSPMKVV